MSLSFHQLIPAFVFILFLAVSFDVDRKAVVGGGGCWWTAGCLAMQPLEDGFIITPSPSSIITSATAAPASPTTLIATTTAPSTSATTTTACMCQLASVINAQPYTKMDGTLSPPVRFVLAADGTTAIPTSVPCGGDPVPIACAPVVQGTTGNILQAFFTTAQPNAGGIMVGCQDADNFTPPGSTSDSEQFPVKCSASGEILGSFTTGLPCGDTINPPFYATSPTADIATPITDQALTKVNCVGL